MYIIKMDLTGRFQEVGGRRQGIFRTTLLVAIMANLMTEKAITPGKPTILEVYKKEFTIPVGVSRPWPGPG